MQYELKSIVMLALALLGAGCTTLTGGKLSDRGDSSLNSILWVQDSSEYMANTTQAYNMAAGNLKAAVDNPAGTALLEQTGSYASLPPAIIMDIDETVLDNSPYHFQLVQEDAEFNPATWDHWVSLRQAKAIPGSVDFINYAKSIGVEVIFITNRECGERRASPDKCPQKKETVDNLEQIGITTVDAADVLMKNEQEGWSSEKEGRRKVVAKKYRVIMLFGDDLSDFLPQVQKNITAEQRAVLVRRHANKWGMAWYILPNPKYGSWLKALEQPTLPQPGST